MEIERKFLVDQKLWDRVEKGEGKLIKQGYFISTEKYSIRVRTKGEMAFITLKGPKIGLSSTEFEYEIPLKDAYFMLSHYATPFLEKTRYEIEYHGKIWEVDEFHGKIAPLLLAEVELESENEIVDIPNWVTEEVSENTNYLNANIIKQLYE